MAGFVHEGIRFQPDDGFTIVGFDAPEDHVEEGLALGTPGARASWLAARLAALTERDPQIFTGEIEVEEDGLFIVDLLAEVESGRVLAKLQLQADPEEVAVLGVAGDAEGFARAAAALVGALGASDALADVEVEVARSDEDVPVRYGRRAGRLL